MQNLKFYKGLRNYSQLTAGVIEVNHEVINQCGLLSAADQSESSEIFSQQMFLEVREQAMVAPCDPSFKEDGRYGKLEVG